jgi:hypothetical protein
VLWKPSRYKLVDLLGAACLLAMLTAERTTCLDTVSGICRNDLQLAGAICASAAIGYVILWGFYGFRYAARPEGLVMMAYRLESATGRHFEESASRPGGEAGVCGSDAASEDASAE